MSDFLRHAPCPKCGSKDNLALYRNGSGYCFGCGFFSKPSKTPYVIENKNEHLQDVNRSRITQLETLVQGSLSGESVNWLSSYGVLVPEALRRGCRGGVPGNNSLYFTWYSNTGVLLLAQERPFPKEGSAKRKYITYGILNEVLPIYYHRDGSRRTDKLVIVEDAVSAIKIARISDAMPCLGSDLPAIKLKRLAGLYKAFTVWLDGNMYDKAQAMAQKLQMLGCEAKAIYTSLDPKCYDTPVIEGVLTSFGFPGTIEVVDFLKT